jgi:hypothetical protein
MTAESKEYRLSRGLGALAVGADMSARKQIGSRLGRKA